MIRQLVLFVSTLCAGCSTDPSPVDQTTAPTVDLTLFAPEIQEFHGENHLLTLLYPDRVESYRISKVGGNGSPGVDHAESDYEVVSSGPDLTASQIEHLRPLFTDMRGYFQLRHKEWQRYNPKSLSRWGRGCGWNPGVLLRFYRGDASVAVVLCFDCNEWAFEACGKRYRWASFGEVRGETRFNGLRPALRSLVIKLFPDDSGVQGIAPLTEG